jgi:hypothetical protein
MKLEFIIFVREVVSAEGEVVGVSLVCGAGEVVRVPLFSAAGEMIGVSPVSAAGTMARVSWGSASDVMLSGIKVLEMISVLGVGACIEIWLSPEDLARSVVWDVPSDLVLTL